MSPTDLSQEKNRPSLRILRVITTMNPAAGGPSQGLRNLCPELEKLGVENEVVCLDDPDEAYLTDSPVTCHGLGRARGSWAKQPRLRTWLDEHLENYDAVVCHGLWQYPALATSRAVAAARRRNPQSHLKFFVMPHGMLDPWFQRDPSRRIKALRNTLYWHALENRTIAEADALFFTCQRELELARETFWRYRPKRELDVGYGVPTPPARSGVEDQVFRERCPKLSAKPYLLFLSRIHPKKGVDLLIDAYRGLLAAPPGITSIPELVIAGPIDNDYAQQMIQRAADLPSVHFPGMLQGEAKWAAFYGCEAFVLPSHQENFGIAVTEALACGKPVLISDQINIYPEITAPNAGIVKSDSPVGTEALLSEWAQLDASQRHLMAQNAMACYQTKFASAAAGQKFAQTIRSLCSSNPAA